MDGNVERLALDHAQEIQAQTKEIFQSDQTTLFQRQIFRVAGSHWRPNERTSFSSS